VSDTAVVKDASVQRILVIKLGALGDFVLALGPYAAIRNHHPHAHIILLTTAPYVDFADASKYFDEVWIDDRMPWWRPDCWLALRRRLNSVGFDRVYDLQTSDRSGWYFRLFGHNTEWSGIVAGCSHPHDNPDRDRMHTLERQAEQLAIAGIETVPPPELVWATAEIDQFEIGSPSVLIAPGGAPHRPGKRWPASSYLALARALVEAGYQPVLIGTSSELEISQYIVAGCDGVKDLTGRTTLLEIAELARLASVAVGNDTGPMHIAAAAGCRSVVLFSSDSDPALTAPRGRSVTVLRQETLADLPVDDVLAALVSD
jgi:ADP-heptose:LPS heptosyltransferase